MWEWMLTLFWGSMDELKKKHVIFNEFQAPRLKSCQKVRQYKCTKLTKIVVTVAAKNVARIAYFFKKMAHPHFENVRVCVMNTIYMIKSENPLRKTMNWCLVRSSPWTRLPDTTSYKPILLSTTSMITNVWYVFGYVFWYSTPFYP